MEFKANYADPQEIGEYISALSNSAALCGKTNGYLVWGVDDGAHDISGTAFRPELARKGGEELESWLLRLTSPRIHFRFHRTDSDGKYVNREFMTNTTLRERFGIDPKNSAVASRVIKDTAEQGLIRLSDPDSSRKYSKYIQFWA